LSTILKFLSALWLTFSIGLLGIVSLSLYSGHDLDFGTALYEGFEVIPEAIFMLIGFDGSPMVADLIYWICLFAGIFTAWRGRASR